jgi:hypothetical protein
MKTKMKGVMSYVPEDDHRKVRAMLLRDGISFSEWVRFCMRRALTAHAEYSIPKAKRGKA